MSVTRKEFFFILLYMIVLDITKASITEIVRYFFIIAVIWASCGYRKKQLTKADDISWIDIQIILESNAGKRFVLQVARSDVNAAIFYIRGFTCRTVNFYIKPDCLEICKCLMPFVYWKKKREILFNMSFARHLELTSKARSSCFACV